MKTLKQILAQAFGRVAGLLDQLPAKRVEMGIAVLVTLVAVATYSFVATGNRFTFFLFLQNMELRSLDAMFKARGSRPVDPRIVIVGLDENTIRKVGAFPIPRDGYARLVDKLAEGGAKVVAFDFNFPAPEKNSAVEALKKLEAEVGPAVSPAVLEKMREVQRTSDNDAILAASLKRSGNVILGHSFLDAGGIRNMDSKAMEDYYNILWGQPFAQVLKAKTDKDFDMFEAWRRNGGQTTAGVLPNIGLLAEGARSYGFYDVTPDADGTVRASTLLVRYADADWFPSLPLQTVRVYEDIKEQDIAAYIDPSGMDRVEMGPHNISTRGDATVLVNFAGPYRSYPHFSMGEIGRASCRERV